MAKCKFCDVDEGCNDLEHTEGCPLWVHGVEWAKVLKNKSNIEMLHLVLMKSEKIEAIAERAVKVFMKGYSDGFFPPRHRTPLDDPSYRLGLTRALAKSEQEYQKKQ